MKAEVLKFVTKYYSEKHTNPVAVLNIIENLYMTLYWSLD
jgi:hypothetical protein